MKDICVSVLIPVYNRQEMLRNALASILQQTHHNIKVFVYNDGSTDNPEKTVKDFNDKRIIYFGEDENKGAAYARNKLLNISKGSICCWQDSDDWSNIYRIDRQLLLLKKNVVVTGSYVRIKRPTELWNMLPEHTKNPAGCFVSSMFFNDDFVSKFDPLITKGGSDFYWQEDMKKRNVYIACPFILYYLYMHKHRIGTWKKNRSLSPEWYDRMTNREYKIRNDLNQ